MTGRAFIKGARRPREPISLGARIRKWRTRRNMTLEHLAHAAGVSKGYLSHVETDKAVPTVFVAERIAVALGSGLDSLLSGVARPRPRVRTRVD